MKRPVMDPMSMLDEAEPGPRVGRSGAMRERLRQVAHAARAVSRVLFSKPFKSRRRDPDSDQPVSWRFVRGLGYRLLFVPIFVALAASALVYRGTHPVRLTSQKLPEVPPGFYETLEFNGPDGHPLMAWHIPVVDAKRVIELKNKVFKEKQPAVVLVHDYNGSPSQMVPLAGPLHEQGFVVMIVGLRGAGRGKVAAQTFGLNEANDVRAALAELRNRPTVDAERLAVVGVGSGANAAVIAASSDPGVRALVLIDPSVNPEQAIAEHIGPRRPGLRWMQHAAKWAFEVAYHVDAEDLRLGRFHKVLTGRPTLSLTRGAGEEFDADTIDAIRAFCQQHIPPQQSDAQVVASAQ